MGRTRMGPTDGLTDGRTWRRLYAPPKCFGEHNKIMALNSVKLEIFDLTHTVLTWSLTLLVEFGLLLFSGTHCT